jgi:hypothetical protein
MVVVAIDESWSDGETGPDTNGRAAPEVKVTASEIVSDGCGLLFSQVARTLGGGREVEAPVRALL